MPYKLQFLLQSEAAFKLQEEAAAAAADEGNLSILKVAAESVADLLTLLTLDPMNH